MESVYLTHNGINRLKSDLKHLLKVVRPEATRELARARALGDLSENAEYDAAKENMVSIDRRIHDLQQKLGNVQLINEKDFDCKQVRILSKVTVQDLKRNKQMTFTLVDPVQADPAELFISFRSPIAKGLLGKRPGDEVEIDVPAGQLLYKVVKIEVAEGV